MITIKASRILDRYSILTALCFAAADLQAQTNNPPATNLPPATPPLVSTNAISLSNYKHALTDVRRMTRPDDPRNSRDRHFDWWPRFGRHQQADGTNDWIQYSFEKPSTISESKVYWYQDIPTGGCAVPESWRFLYLDGDQWKPVEANSKYTVSTNAYDAITFKPVTTTAVRLEIKFQQNYSVGMEAWKVK
jgi:hypothetical protein